MNYEKILIWLFAMLAASVLLIGAFTGFTFETIEIQLHDTYYVVDAVTAIVCLTILFLIIKRVFTPLQSFRNHQFLEFICVVVTGMVLFIPAIVLYFKAWAILLDVR